MKYVIEIFENGDRTDVLVTNDKYDWDGYSKVFSDIMGSYVKKDTRQSRQLSGHQAANVSITFCSTRMR